MIRIEWMVFQNYTIERSCFRLSKTAVRYSPTLIIHDLQTALQPTFKIVTETGHLKPFPKTKRKEIHTAVSDCC